MPDGSALGRLVGALQKRRATSLAIDVGQPDVAEQLAQARQELAAARAEVERSSWRPGRRDKRRQARSRASQAQARVDRLSRVAAEQRHVGRRFVNERSAADAAARQRDRIIERQLDRGRTRGLER